MLQDSLRIPGDEAPSCRAGTLHAERGTLPRVNARLCSLLFKLFGRESTYSSSYDPHASSGFIPGSTLRSLMECFCLSLATGSSTFLQCWNNITVRKSETGAARVSHGGCEQSQSCSTCPALGHQRITVPIPGLGQRRDPKKPELCLFLGLPTFAVPPLCQAVPGWAHQPGPLLTVSRERRVQVRNYSDF